MGTDAEPRGFSLAEALVALAVLTLGVLLGLSIAAREPRLSARLRAHEGALRAADSALETLRSGALPLETGTLPAAAAGAAPGIVLSVSVSPRPVPGLYEIAVEARYLAQGRIERREVRSMVWRP